LFNKASTLLSICNAVSAFKQNVDLPSFTICHNVVGRKEGGKDERKERKKKGMNELMCHGVGVGLSCHVYRLPVCLLVIPGVSHLPRPLVIPASLFTPVFKPCVSAVL